MTISRSLGAAVALLLLSPAPCVYAQTPLPQLSDSGLQSCLNETSAQQGWQFAEQVTSLSCVARGVVQIEGVEQLINLEQLNLANNQLLDVAPLGQLSKLFDLNLAGNSRLSVRSLSLAMFDLANLTALNLNGVNVGSIYNLHNLINPSTGQPRPLVALDLSNTRYRDAQDGSSIEFVRNLPTLKKLSMAGNNLTNVDPIGALAQLEELDLSHNRLEYLGGFAGNGLKRLNLSGNRQLRVHEAARVIAQNPGLIGIGLNGVKVGDVTNLGPLTDPGTGAPLNLQEFDLGNTGLKDRGGANADAGFLRVFVNLKQLNLANLGLSEVAALSSLQQMEQLDLSGNQLQSAGALGLMRNLARLNLSGNRNLRFDEVYYSVLANNPGLRSIGLNGINIGFNSHLLASLTNNPEQARNMAELDLGNTALDDSGLSLLGAFPNLRKLNLAGNRFSAFANYDVLRGALYLRELDLSDNALRDGSALFALRELTHLNLSRTGLRREQVRPLVGQNPNLTSLKLSGIQIGQIVNLGELRNDQSGQILDLTELDLSYTGLLGRYGDNRIFDFLHYMPNMVRLNLAGNGIGSLYEYGNMRHLAEFDVSHNQLSSLSPSGDLSQLVRLNLSGNSRLGRGEVTNWLSGSPSLNSIGVNGIRLSSLADLGSLVDPRTGQPLDLIELDVGNTGLVGPDGQTSLDFLLPFVNLQRLNLAGNGMANIAALASLKQLRELDLSSNGVVDIGALNQLRNLTRLNLSGNSAIDVQQLRDVLNLQTNLIGLSVNGIALRDFSALGPLFNPQTGQPYKLLELDLGHTQLSAQGNSNPIWLTSFPDLQRLNLASNGLTSLLGLAPLTQVRELDVSNNNLSDLREISALTGLTTLRLSGNAAIPRDQLGNLVRQNSGLTRLGLNGIALNSLADLNGLIGNNGSLLNLVELDLGNTLATDLDGLSFLAGFPNLSRLNLAGNHLSNIAGIRIFAPQSQLLDLDLSNNALSSPADLYGMFSLQTLNLAGNAALRCFDLDILVSSLPTTQLTRPVPCVPDNQPPVADAGANQTVESGTSVQLNGVVSDSDGSIVSINWQQTAGPAVALASSTAALTSFVAPDVAQDTVLTFQLNTQDDKGATAGSSTNVTVKPRPNALPLANAGANQTVESGTSVQLNGVASDSDGSIVSITWQQTAGPAVVLASSTAALTSFVAPDVANDTVFTFQLNVQDNKGATAGSSTNVTVKPRPNALPVANAGAAQSVNEGSTVTLSGSATDSDGSIASYAWVQTAGPAVTLLNPNAAVASFVAPPVSADTVLSFRLTVIDNRGGSAVANTSVTIKDTPDLTVTSIATSTVMVKRGGSFNLTLSTTNAGTKSSGIASFTGVYLTTSPSSVSTSNTRIGHASVSSTLTGGSASRVTISVSVPTGLAAGTYYIGAIADYTALVAEGNETNNTLVGPKLIVK